MKQSLNLQALRGISVLLVVLFHMGFHSFRNGWIGVDIFFVISGFLMWHLYIDQIMHHDIAGFYRKRLKRLLPALSISILISGLIFLFRLPPGQRGSMINELSAASLGLSNVYYWLVDHHSSNADLRPLITLWSIALELQFYLAFPLIVFLVKRSTRRLVLLMCCSSIAYALLGFFSYEAKLYTLPGKFCEFLLGMIVASLLQKYGYSRRRFQFASLLFVSFIVFLLFVSLRDRSEIILQVLAACISAYFILVGFREDTRNFLVRFLAKIGDYSYSIYLIHFPLFVFIGYSESLGNPSHLETPIEIIVFILILGFGSWALKNFVEDNKWFRDNYVRIFLATVSITTSLLFFKSQIVSFG